MEIYCIFTHISRLTRGLVTSIVAMPKSRISLVSPGQLLLFKHGLRPINTNPNKCNNWESGKTYSSLPASLGTEYNRKGGFTRTISGEDS